MKDPSIESLIEFVTVLGLLRFKLDLLIMRKRYIAIGVTTVVGAGILYWWYYSKPQKKPKRRHSREFSFGVNKEESNVETIVLCEYPNTEQIQCSPKPLTDKGDTDINTTDFQILTKPSSKDESIPTSHLSNKRSSISKNKRQRRDDSKPDPPTINETKSISNLSVKSKPKYKYSFDFP